MGGGGAAGQGKLKFSHKGVGEKGGVIKYSIIFIMGMANNLG